MGKFTQKWYGKIWVKMLCCLILLGSVGFGEMGEWAEIDGLLGFLWEGGKGGNSEKGTT
jgi:hypothetical protein